MSETKEIIISRNHIGVWKHDDGRAIEALIVGLDCHVYVSAWVLCMFGSDVKAASMSECVLMTVYMESSEECTYS